MKLDPSDFAPFFRAVHGYDPFLWQEALTRQVYESGEWPSVIDLPTASGKTACLDIALFLLAVREGMPRRIFFVVDRRVIVNEAFIRMQRVKGRLVELQDPTVRAVADLLRERAGKAADAVPLHVTELRGGIFRDKSWIEDMLQPTIVTSTVDQVGSRLLFRGYGVSPSTQPIHAALTANDSLILLDEAHCSRAFAQTLGRIKKYRGWNKEDIGLPFATVEMTATPSSDVPPERRFRLADADRSHPVLRQRLSAAKPTRLEPVKTRVNGVAEYAEKLAAAAVSLAAQPQIDKIAVMVNRVPLAREVHSALCRRMPGADCHLLIGRMRPIDRDDLMTALTPFQSGASSDPGVKRFVVSTQCLEVGADFDFHGLVTEVASIDALLQRMGRLDRLGTLNGAARAIVLGPSDRIESKDPDPIYGESLKECWQWLTKDGVSNCDFGIESLGREQKTIAELLRELSPQEASKLKRLSPSAVVMLPAHLDLLAQTSPAPAVSPDVSLYLHGVAQPNLDVQIVFRHDLGVDTKKWEEIVRLCPPVSAEALPARLWDVRAWMRGAEGEVSRFDSDVEGTEEPDSPRRSLEDVASRGPVLRWCGDESEVLSKPNSVRPGDTLIVPCDAEGIERLGYIPPSGRDERGVRDWGDRATHSVRRRVCLRLTPSMLAMLNSQELTALTSVEDPPLSDIRKALSDIAGDLPESWLRRLVEAAATSVTERADHPGGGCVLLSRSRFLAEEDGGGDETSFVGGAVSLPAHTEGVRREAGRLASRVQPARRPLYEYVARLHDAGKTDVRIQTFFRRGDRLAAEFAPIALAKSGFKGGATPLRHEFLSLQFAAKSSEPVEEKDLALHLIGSHHGWCRPFAKFEPLNDHPDRTEFDGLVITRAERLQSPAHHLSSGVAKRFWKFTRHFGWWGLPYLEAILRLADWSASSFKEES